MRYLPSNLTGPAAIVFAAAFAIALPCAHAADAGPATTAIDDQFRAGNPKAPVTLVIYACPRSEACAKLIPDVHREVTTGSAKEEYQRRSGRDASTGRAPIPAAKARGKKRP
jgi:hypothetical protein